jgi:hypothetical protein
VLPCTIHTRIETGHLVFISKIFSKIWRQKKLPPNGKRRIEWVLKRTDDVLVGNAEKVALLNGELDLKLGNGLHGVDPGLWEAGMSEKPRIVILRGGSQKEARIAKKIAPIPKISLY